MTKPMLAKKISVKTVCGRVRVPRYEEGEHKGDVIPDQIIPLMSVVGFASGVKYGESDLGPWEALTGGFQAQNLATGAVFRSGVCFLPDVGHDMVAGQLKSQDGNHAVEFAFKISAKSDPEAATGYVYVAESLMDVAESDPVAMIVGKIGNALPAPSTTPQIEDKSDEATEDAPPQKRAARGR